MTTIVALYLIQPGALVILGVLLVTGVLGWAEIAAERLVVVDRPFE